VWTIPPPETWEKRFGKHPTQKPVALLERILLAASNEGDLVLDPFAGSGTTLLMALRLRRHAVGCELSAEWLSFSLRRICSDLIQVQLSIGCVEFSVDPSPDPVDRSICKGSKAERTEATMPPQLQLVQQECRFYFIGKTQREVIFSAIAECLEEARQKFRASGHADADAIFIIKTETEIYMA